LTFAGALPARFSLPAALEIVASPEVASLLDWADFLAIDLPLAGLVELRHHLGLASGVALHTPAQVLIMTAMPCAGIAECGACAVPLRRRRFGLACQDGPVFDLHALEW